MIKARSLVHSKLGYKPVIYRTPNIDEMIDGIPQLSVVEGIMTQYFSNEGTLYGHEIGSNVNYEYSKEGAYSEFISEENAGFCYAPSGFIDMEIGTQLARGLTQWAQAINPDGEFTATTDGIYSFSASMHLSTIDAGLTGIEVSIRHKDTSDTILNSGDSLRFERDSGSVQGFKLSRILRMSAGDTASIFLKGYPTIAGAEAVIGGNVRPFFAAFKIDSLNKGISKIL